VTHSLNLVSEFINPVSESVNGRLKIYYSRQLLPIPGKIYLVLALAFCSYTLASVSYVSWLSWMSDLIPDRMRGRFFGTRNMVCGAAGITVMFIFGHLLDYLKAQPGHDLSLGFGITFATAVALGLWGLSYLRKMSEPPMARNGAPAPFRMHLALPFTSPNFRRFAFFALVWNFSVYFASPFFTLYFLRDLKFSYGFVALMGMTSAFADLVGMQVWGRISDKVKNKAVIQVGSWVAAFLPLAWVTVRPDSVAVPLVLNLVAGGFWAGINLCMNNLLLRITPQENRGSFLSVYNALAGLGAAAGPVLAGLAVKSVGGMVLHVASWQISSLQFVFVASTIMRILSVPLLTYVREPEAATIGQMVRIIRSVRGLNTANGFTSMLHPFIETVRHKERPPDQPQ